MDDGALSFRQDNGWSIGCSLKWTGITGKIQASAGTAKKEGVEQKTAEPGKEKKMDEKLNKSVVDHELIGGIELGKWVFPDKDAKYTPAVMPRADLHELLVEKLTEGKNIRVKTGSSYGFNQYMSYEDMANAIEKKIHARNDIKRDPKTMEALVFDIRARLERVMGEIDSGFHLQNMDLSRFKVFVEGGELKRRLDKIIDPLQEVLNTCT